MPNATVDSVNGLVRDGGEPDPLDAYLDRKLSGQAPRVAADPLDVYLDSRLQAAPAVVRPAGPNWSGAIASTGEAIAADRLAGDREIPALEAVRAAKQAEYDRAIQAWQNPSMAEMRPLPEPTFTQNLVTGAKQGWYNALPRGLKADPSGLPPAYASGLPAGGAGGLIGNTAGGLVPIMGTPEGMITTALGGAAGRGLANVMGPVTGKVAERLGGRAAAAFEEAITNAVPGAAQAAAQHASQEDWDGDPVGALIRTLSAAGVGGALGAGTGAAVGSARTGPAPRVTMADRLAAEKAAPYGITTEESARRAQMDADWRDAQARGRAQGEFVAPGEVPRPGSEQIGPEADAAVFQHGVAPRPEDTATLPPRAIPEQPLQSRPEPVVASSPDPSPEYTTGFTEALGGLGAKLDARAAAALERVKNRRLPTQPGQRSAGGTTLFADTVDLGIYVANKAAAAGVRGGMALKQIVWAAAAEHAPELRDRWKDVQRVARGILDDAHPDGAYDDAAFERAVAAVRAVGTPKPKPDKEAIREATGQAPQPKTITEPQALKAAMGKAERAAGVAFRAGRQEAQAEARVKMGELVESARAKRDTADGIRAEAVRLLESVPRQIKGGYLAAVRDATSLPRLAALLRRAHGDMIAYEARQSIKGIDRINDKQLRSLEPEMLTDADAALNAAQRARSVVNRLTQRGAARPRIAELGQARAELASALKTVKGLIHEQKNLDTVRIGSEVVEAKQIRDEILGALSGKKELPASRQPGEPDVGIIRRTLRRRTNLDTLLKSLDGSVGAGPGSRLMGQVLRGRRESLRLQHEFQDQLGEIVRKHGYRSLSQFQAELSGTLGNKSQKRVNVKVGPFDDLSMGQAAYLYAASKDRGVQQRVDAGQKWQFADDAMGEPFTLTRADLDAVAKALPDNVRAAVDEAKALYDRHYFDRLSAVNKRMKGYHLEKEPGYFGIKLNRQYSEGKGTPFSWRRSMIRALEMSGVLQERVGPSKTPMLIGDFGTDIINRSQGAATIIGKAETTKLLSRTLLHPEVQTAMSRRMGTADVKRLERRISLYSGGDMYTEAGAPALRAVQSMWARGKTQLWIPTWARNAISGTTRVLNELPPAAVAKQSLLRLPPTWSEFAELMKYSPEMRERWDGRAMSSFYDGGGVQGAEAKFKQAMGATVKQLWSMVADAARLRWSEVRAAMAGAGTAWKSVLDAVRIGNYFDAVPAIMAYRHFKEVAPPNLSPEARAKWAARHATRVFERVSNTATVEYANDVQLDARENFWMQSLIPFTGDTAKAMNMLAEAKQKGPGAFVKTGLVLATGALASAAVSSAWSAARGDKDWKQAGVIRFLQELFGLVPVVGLPAGQAVPRVIRGPGTRAPELESPVLSLINDGLGVPEQLFKAYEKMGVVQKRRALTWTDHLSRAVEQAAQVGSDLSGTPVAQYLKFFQKASEQWSGGEPKRR